MSFDDIHVQIPDPRRLGSREKKEDRGRASEQKEKNSEGSDSRVTSSNASNRVEQQEYRRERENRRQVDGPVERKSEVLQVPDEKVKHEVIPNVRAGVRDVTRRKILSIRK